MKTKIKLASGLIIALFLTFMWACKKDDNTSNNPPGQDSFTDPRDGKVYTTIKVDSLTWFAENLDYDTVGAFDYPLKSTNGDNYGKLYTFDAAKFACPDGWHLSTNGNWKALLMSMGMNASEAAANGFNGTDQGKRLKSTTGWMSNGNGTDEIGFKALPAGRLDGYGDYVGKGEEANFWTSTQEALNAVYSRAVLGGRDDVRQGPATVTSGAAFSVRCVKDYPK